MRLLAGWENRRSRDERRAQGAIWTPDHLAAWMAEWVGESGPEEVLDPAAGAGALLAPFQGGPRLVACERDQELRAVLRARFPEAQVGEDFWRLDPQRRFGAIVANPPYIGHAQIDGKRELHARLVERTGVRLPLSSNLAVLFYLDCWSRLAERGRMMFLMPTEFMQTRSGADFKRFLVDHGALSAVVDLEDEGLFGAGVVSTACLALAAKPGTRRIRFARHDGRAPHPPWAELLGGARALGREQVDPERRWRPERHGSGAADSRPLSDLVLIEPGVITGRNGYFLLSHPEAVRRGIAGSVRYCLIRPHQLEGEWFHDDAEVARISEGPERRFLVAIGRSPDALERAYLDEGEATGVNETPTARGRDPWWAQHSGPPCDFAIGNFRRSDYRLTIRTSGGVPAPMDWAVVPNRITLRPEHRDLVWVLAAYLLSASGQAALRVQERHAGSGLYTLRSGALKTVRVPHLERTSPQWRAQLEQAFAELAAADLAGHPGARAEAKALIDALCAAPVLVPAAV